MWNSNKESLCVVCDVGSATISAGLVHFRKNQKPNILYTASLPISVVPEPNQSQLESLMLGFLDAAMKSISSDGLASAKKQGVGQKKIDNVFVTFASPWYASKATDVVIEKGAAFVLDEKLIRDAMVEEEKSFEGEAIGGQFEQVKGKDIRMIEREMVAVKLNGYETTEPYEKRATNAELSLYMSLIPEHILAETEKIVHSHLHAERITFHTFPLMFFGAVKKLFPHDQNYVLVDAAGESTDVSLIRNGTIVKSLSFDIGYNTLIRSVMSKLNINEEIAHSYLHLSESKNAENSLQDEINKVLLLEKNEWNNNFKIILDKFSAISKIPHICFFVSNAESLALYDERLKEIGVANGFSQVAGLTSQSFVDYIEYGKFASENQFLGLEVLYIKNHDLIALT